jgi:predicted regulator of Ras-like GTPase activity (Roadblock/LC7/MglB family)
MRSIFGEILGELLQDLPLARGAIFVDWEGEAVDHASSRLGDTSIRLMGAHWGVIYSLAQAMFAKLECGTPHQLALTFLGERVIVQQVSDAYFIVVTVDPACALSDANHALARARERLRHEM